jgi:hypothetical protein
MVSGIGDGIMAMMIFIAIICLAIGGLAVWLLPKAWMWLKPIIHTMTA